MVTIFLLLILGLSIGFGNLLALIIASVLIAIVVLIFVIDHSEKKEEERKKKVAERKAVRIKERKEKEDIFYYDRLDYVQKYGEPDNEIIIADNDIDQVIMVFGSARRILIMGKDLPFSDILSFSFDNHFNNRRGLVIHDYNVIVNINSLSCPIIRVPLGYDSVKANEIAGLLNVIINLKE